MLKKLVFFLLVVLFAAPLSAQTVSLSSLLAEMVDRDAITKFPDPAYVCVQASSYDRTSKSPDQPGWFANGDASQFIREETNGDRKEWVLMDAAGPGAIVRWWITSHHYKSVCRVYLDGSDKPAIEANIGDLIGGPHLAGTPASPSPLSAERAKGRNLYLPIPYAKHCKVTVDDMPEQKNLYYQINYRTYAEGTKVETFSMDGFKSLKEKVDSVQKTLLKDGEELASNPPVDDIMATFPIRTGGVPHNLFKRNVANGGVLRKIILKVNADGEKLTQALRSTVLSIKFDGKETVWCPLGDFFGGGVGVNPYKSWYTRIEKDGTMVSLWRMPFKNSIEFDLINYGNETVDVTLKGLADIKDAGKEPVWFGPYQWTDRSMYFHADWRQDRKIETVRGDGTMDWNYIKLRGKGVFVGDVLSVLNRNPAWWGEGDEKIYVDGEGTPVPEGGKGVLPSHFGTGTEDYYGYAWCTPQFFESPFHFQPRAEGPSNYGNTTNGRVRLLDGIPFTKDFRFDMEVWHWAATKIDYSVVNFWYGFADAETVDFQSREKQIEELKAEVLYKTPMSLEIPGFKIEKIPTRGNIQVQGLQSFSKEGRKWRDNDHLWWTGAKPGDKLELLYDIEKDGKYKFVGELTKARDYGIVQFTVDGQKIGNAVDLYNPEVVPTGPMHLGTVELKAGRHTVTVEITGKNDKADASYMVGIDVLEFVTE